MAVPPDEERELWLVDKVELNILNAANDEAKLSALLLKFLPPLILKINAESQTVRNKTRAVLRRLHTFIQPPAVTLPVKSLLEQYKNTNSVTVKTFDLSFIHHSLDRLDVDDRRDLVPIALRGLAQDKGSSLAVSIINIVLRLLLDVQIPPRGSNEDGAFRSSLCMSDDDASYLAYVIGLVFRLRNSSTSRTLEQSNPALAPEELTLLTTGGFNSAKVLDRLSELRVKLVSLLASGAFTDQEKYLPAIYAAASGDNRVAESAEEIIKRTSVSLEDPVLVEQLFKVHSSLTAPYRTRILRELSKSTLSTTMTDDVIAVIDRDFAPPPSPAMEGPSRNSMSALEKTKLHTALFKYLSHVAKVGSSRPHFAVAGPLIKSMISYIEGQGWPAPTHLSREEETLRRAAYDTIGMLGSNVQQSAADNLTLAAWLFRSLSEDTTAEAVTVINAALSGLTRSIPPEVGDTMVELKELLLKYMDLPDEPPAVRSTRYAVVKWANDCLSYPDFTGRWIDIMAIAGRPNEQKDVIELGRKGLEPSNFLDSAGNVGLPAWGDMAQWFFMGTVNPVPKLTVADVLNEPVLARFQGSKSHALPVALDHLKYMMLLEAAKKFTLSQGWVEKLLIRIRSDNGARHQAREYHRLRDPINVIIYLHACLCGAFGPDPTIVEQCLRNFVEVASISPREHLAALVGLFGTPVTGGRMALFTFIASSNLAIRKLAAKAIGIFVAHPDNTSENVTLWANLLRSSLSNAKQSAANSNGAEGALLALGYLGSCSVYYGRNLEKDAEYPLHLLIESGTPYGLYVAALDAFPVLWSAKLAIPPKEGPMSARNIILKLSAEAKRAGGLAELAIKALGALALGLDDNDDSEVIEIAGTQKNQVGQGTLGLIINELLSMHELKALELRNAVGIALAAAVARWDSRLVSVLKIVDSENLEVQQGARMPLLEGIIQRLLRDSKSTKPSLLRSSGSWLYGFAACCGSLGPIRSRLRELQVAFMRHLTAKDPMVQDTAAEGLTTIYELGDSETKKALVKDLVSAFTGNGVRLQVGNETELFDAGALPTGEGQSVTSYKDIMSLANEVGDQKLVYKFMALATNAATWGLRSAFGQFGLGKILSEAEIDPKLYVKLYRYRFDPSENVQRSMERIWRAVAEDSNAKINEHFDAIMEDLVQNIANPEWRVRQASCAALSDLIQGRPFERYKAYYQGLWTSVLRVVDDDKVSVRQVAFRLCQVLSNTLVRQLEEDRNAATTTEMLRIALPFLISTNGIESRSREAKLFAIQTLIGIAKHGGKTLRPVIPTIVVELLKLYTGAEDDSINAAYQRLGDKDRSLIDEYRTREVRQSPIQQALDSCLRFVDNKVMLELAPGLEQCVKGTSGNTTKIACARVLITLATLNRAEFEPVSDRFLRLLEKLVLEDGIEISRAYADASAYVMRTSTQAAQTRFCKHIIDVYMQAEDETRRTRSANVIAALARVSPDLFSSREAELMPFAYLGSHDCDAYISKTLKGVWEQHAGSSRIVMRYTPEIAELIGRCLETTRWPVRNAGAFTVAAMVMDISRASETSGQSSEATLKTIWPLFDEALALKTFKGKEKLLESFPRFVREIKPFWQEDADLAAKLKRIAIREAKRNNDEYRIHALRCLWEFAVERDDLDMMEEINQIATPHLDALKDEDRMDVDSRDAAKLKKESATAEAALEAIARGHSMPALPTPERFTAIARSIVQTLEPYLSSSKFDALKREIWYSCVYDLMEHGKTATLSASDSSLANDGSATLTALLQSLDIRQADSGLESQRMMRAKAVGATLRVKNHGALGVFDIAAKADLEAEVRTAVTEERSLDVKREWKTALEELQRSS